MASDRMTPHGLDRPDWAIVPQMTIELPRTVSADWPARGHAPSGVYGPDCLQMNQHGALSVSTPSGWLGVRPAELEVLDMCGADCDCGKPATSLVRKGNRVCDGCYMTHYHHNDGRDWFWRMAEVSGG